MEKYDYSIRRWTKEAKNCYMRGCICEGCPIYELYFKGTKQKCKMKLAVIETVRKFGITDDMKKKDILGD